MTAGRLISIPFALGADEETHPKELPAGPFREVRNIRQRRGHAFGMRPDYTAATMTEFDGTLTPYDLYNLNGRLFALGNRQSLVVPAPTDMFEYVNQPGGAWKGTLPVNGSGTRVPSITKVRTIGRAPDAEENIQTARVAACNGFVCMAYGFGSALVGQNGFVRIYKADTGALLLWQQVAISNMWVVACGNSFWILGVNSASDIEGYRFDTTVDDDLQTGTTLFTGTVTSSTFAACDVNDIPVAQFAFFCRNGAGVTRIVRCNESGTVLASFAGPAVSPDVVAIEADADANEIMVATRVGAADVNVSTYNLTTNALVAGPTAIFGETVEGDISLLRNSLGGSSGILISEDASSRVLKASFVSSTHGSVVIIPSHNYTLGGTGVSSPLGIVMPLISGDQSNQAVIYDALLSQLIYVGAQLDDHVANPLASSAGRGGQICQDRVAGNVNAPYYWVRIVEGAEGDSGLTACILTEFEIASRERRQSCEIANNLFLAGGVPLSFDGSQVFTQGFLERPVFVSSVASAGGGALTSGAEYDFVAVFTMTDTNGRVTRSKVSDIQTVTLGASDNLVTHTVYAPHVERRASNTGGVVFISVYRTDNQALTTTAFIVGARNFTSDPAVAGDFNGLTLQLSINGGATQTVTFGASDNTITELIAAINSQTTGCVASNDGGVIVITTDTAGSGGSVTVIGGTTTTTGTGFSGFITGQTSTGTTTNVKGSIFRLTVTAPVPLSDEFGEGLATLFDITSDTNLLTRPPIYTAGERGGLSGILEHESAPACEFCATVGARVFVGGLADRSEVAISKELFPGEGIAFSSAFAFRSRVDGDVTAVGSLDGSPIAFTADEIFRFSSELPDDNGANGELGTPFRIPSEGGCSNANSIIETSLGLFYQARDTKLMLLPRGGASPVWAGKSIQDALESFPTITGAAYSDADHTVLFTAQNTLGTASIIIVLDLRTMQWYRDTFSSAQVIKSAVDYLGRLAYIDGSTVRLQSSSLTPSAFIEYNVKTGSIKPFGGNSWGKLISITLSAEFRGNCQVRARISYDDGVTWVDFSTVFTLTTASFTAGDSVTCQWWPATRKCSSFVLDFQVLTNGTATPGLLLNEYTLEVIGPPVGRVRTSTSERR